MLSQDYYVGISGRTGYTFNGVATDHSIDLTAEIGDFHSEEATFLFDNTVDGNVLVVVSNKPIFSFYVSCKLVDTTAIPSNTLRVRSFVGSAIKNLTVQDKTNCFTKSGYIHVVSNRLGNTNYELLSRVSNPTVLSLLKLIAPERCDDLATKDRYYYIFDATGSTTVETKIRGINYLFSEDKDLIQEYSSKAIMDSTYLPYEEKTHIFTHQAARDYIISMFEKWDFVSGGGVLFNKKYINQFDVLATPQLKKIAAQIGLGIIFNRISTNPDDIYNTKGKYFMEKGINNLQNKRLSIDFDSNGLISLSERLGTKPPWELTK